MNQPFFSIIVPVYNAQDYLEECISSVLSQDFKDYEVILVNDGSKDNSGIICDNLSKNNDNIIVIHTENSGPLLARQTGIQKSSGKYIMFLDSDDIYFGEALKTLYETIQYTNPDMVIFDWSILYSNSTSEFHLPYKNGKIFKDDINVLRKKFLETSALNSIWSKCIRKNILDINENYSQFKTLKQSEDRLMVAMILDKTETVVYVKQSLYGYCMRENSTQHTMRLKNYKDAQFVSNYLKFYAEKWHLKTEHESRDKYSCLFFAYNVLCSVLNIKCRQERRKSFKETFEFITNDKWFKNSIKFENIKKFPVYQRIELYLLNIDFQNISYLYLRMIIRLQKLKNKLHKE
jgi:glycosyltransferase involved in cell wall biosynthesis